ncbi:uncharacterized protein [Malus domestica]|uniref:uncharacterized protein n=1 Tax=Malus domestica TaxID=3750 RepID=UPI0039766696
MCLALVFAIQKLKHYMLAYTIDLVAKADPYEIIYVPAKAIKGKALADFLADLLIPTNWKISDDLPDEEVFYIDIFPTWMMLFDRSIRADGVGTGVVFMSPQRKILPYSFQLSKLCSNNVAEYQALIIRLQMAINIEITALEVYGDSKLIINQLLTEYEARKYDIVPYFWLATQLLQKFQAVTLEHVPRKENQMANALTNLALSMTLREDEATDVLVCQRWVILLFTEMLLDDTNVISVRKKPIKPWKKHTQAYAERIILDHNYIPAQKNGLLLAMPANSMPTSYINRLNHYTLQLLYGHSMPGN